jgi:glycosyltransferase involved in cell wall biosynthesis
LDKPRILFIQPSYAHYRRSLFDLFHLYNTVLFIFIRSKSTYPSSEGPNSTWNMIFLEKEKHLFWFINLIVYIYKFKPDVIITSINESLQTIISILAGHAQNIPVVLWSETWATPHLFKDNSYWGRKCKEVIIKWTTKRSDAIVASGRRSKNFNMRYAAVKTPIFISYQSTVDQTLNLVDSSINSIKHYVKDQINILYLSRIIELKGLDILIHSFAELEKVYKSAYLIVVGDGPFRGYCEALAKDLLVHNIKFLGSVRNEDVWMFYKQSDIFVLPNSGIKSVDEWGLVINEAASMSLPIVTTNYSGAVGDLVIDGVNGYVVEPGSIAELRNAIEKLLVDNHKRKRMGVESRRLFEAINSYDKMYAGFNSAICSVLGNKKGK